MKRFWLAMLSLGLVLAFSASAFAVDVKFYGSLYVAGMYLDKISLKDSTGTANGQSPADASSAACTAFYYQRLRVNTDFIVAPGLKAVTRFDALERIWGGVRSAAQSTTVTNDDSNSSLGSRAESENIAFDVAYIEYVSPIGMFKAGFMPGGTFGHVFGDSENNGNPAGKLAYAIAAGPVIAGLGMEKTFDKSNSYVQATRFVDRDYEKYSAFVVYKANKDIDAGLAVEHRVIKVAKVVSAAADAPLSALAPYSAKSWALNPYVRAKFGPVSVVAEGTYAWGKADWEDGSLWDTIDIVNMRAIIDVGADFKVAYGGLTLAYVSGDDPETTAKLEGGIALGGKDFNPCLILFNHERGRWAGALSGFTYSTANGQKFASYSGTTQAENEMNNAWFVQGKVGARPIDALDINLSLSYAIADKKPRSTATVGVASNVYGWEVDITGTYKITNNLSYMLGAAYLKTGDYFKGESTDGVINYNMVNNDYLLINKLTLTF